MPRYDASALDAAQAEMQRLAAREAELRKLAAELARVLNECANGIKQVPGALAAIDAALAKARAAGLLN